MKEDGIFVWETGVTLSNDAWADWAPGEPSSSEEDCGELHKGFNYQWNDGRCEDPFPFICEGMLILYVKLNTFKHATPTTKICCDLVLYVDDNSKVIWPVLAVNQNIFV